MVTLKNHRPVRLIDSKGRFDLKPGETVSFSSVPKDLKSLVDNGYLMEVKKKKVEVKANDGVEKTDPKIEQKENTVKDKKPSKQNKGK